MIDTKKIADAIEIRSRIDTRLRIIFDSKIAESAKLHQNYARLWRESAQLMFAGGKRLRPYLTVLIFRAYGGTSAAIYQAAAAQELLHLSLLIHDDIMDHDLIRHGQPNLAGKYIEHYVTDQEPRHLATSAAILAGDLLLAAAHHQLYAADFETGRLRDAGAAFDRSIFEVAGGQLLDMEAHLETGNPQDSLLVARLKTASYSFVGPLHMGAVLAGASTSELEILEQLGNALGTGYQLADDVLGVYGDETVIGKPSLSDIREGKSTYLIRLALAKSLPGDRSWLELHWGNASSTPADLSHAREIIESSGARAAVDSVMQECRKKADDYIALLNIDVTYKNALHDFAERSIWRKF